MTAHSDCIEEYILEIRLTHHLNELVCSDKIDDFKVQKLDEIQSIDRFF